MTVKLLTEERISVNIREEIKVDIVVAIKRQFKSKAYIELILYCKLQAFILNNRENIRPEKCVTSAVNCFANVSLRSYAFQLTKSKIECKLHRWQYENKPAEPKNENALSIQLQHHQLRFEPSI